MLEEKIERLTAETIKLREAVEKNTAAHGGTSPAKPAAAGTKPAAGAKPAKPAKSKFTAADIKAAVIKVKDEVSEDAAKEIISDAGAEGLAGLIAMPEKFDEVMAACEAALSAGDEDEDGLGGL